MADNMDSERVVEQRFAPDRPIDAGFCAVAFSQLKSKGHAARASVIFVGSAMTHPASLPVTFVRNS